MGVSGFAVLAFSAVQGMAQVFVEPALPGRLVASAPSYLTVLCESEEKPASWPSIEEGRAVSPAFAQSPDGAPGAGGGLHDLQSKLSPGSLLATGFRLISPDGWPRGPDDSVPAGSPIAVRADSFSCHKLNYNLIHPLLRDAARSNCSQVHHPALRPMACQHPCATPRRHTSQLGSGGIPRCVFLHRNLNLSCYII